MLACKFIEGDELHPLPNVQKMSEGVPLTYEDRWPWLDLIRSKITHAVNDRRSIVVSCSALRRDYRQHLGRDLEQRLALKRLDARAFVRAERMRVNDSASVFSVRFRRVTHSPRPDANHESPVFSIAAIAQCRSACQQPIARRAIRDRAPTNFLRNSPRNRVIRVCNGRSLIALSPSPRHWSERASGDLDA
ncbi:hypothetical protein Rleg5DRAFT_1328 [Rhizobium leguminosarum bv. viciae WSM1455]|nr:hypothetical protein Rleg5DRAFT_1328 [Rhizobium leguminosarum bv. viciae WSM1455]